MIQEKEFQATLDKFKDYPKLNEFKSEALEANKLLTQQLIEFCSKLSQAEPFCDITSSLIQNVITLRQEIDDADEKISEFLNWQDTEKGKEANLPRIEEKHKEILFTEWEHQIMKAERAISRARSMMNNITQFINDSLYSINLISDCVPGSLPKVKETENRWKEEMINKSQQIDKLQAISWENMWTYLIKPNNQQMAIKFLSNAVDCLIPEFSDATYAGQLHSEMSHPPRLQDMLKICNLASSSKREKQ